MTSGPVVFLMGPTACGKTAAACRLADEFAAEIISVDSALVYRGLDIGTAKPSPIVLARYPHHLIDLRDPGERYSAAQFRRDALESLRQPLEDGQVCISRAAQSLTYPASFMMVAAMNPCPCGFLGDSQHSCTCTPALMQRYRTRLSGPLLDRIDLQVEVPRLPHKALADTRLAEASEMVRGRVEQARQVQQERFAGSPVHCNARMGPRQLQKFCWTDKAGQELLQQVTDRLGLSARSYTRLLKVGRTIADLAGSVEIGPVHLAEAIQYRSLDRKTA